MKNKKVIRLFTAMLAVVLCMTAFSVTAFAGGGDGDYYTGEPAETLPELTEEPATGGMEPEGQPLTPEGNATLVDDYYGDKQLITVTTKAGNYFYILIDRANEDKETAVHFLNQVDEADLMALMEDGQTEEKHAACTCAEKCQAGAVNTACPICAVNMSECAGKAPEVEPEPEPEPEKESGSGGALVLILLLAALGGGGAFAYIKFIKPKQAAKAPKAEAVQPQGQSRKANKKTAAPAAEPLHKEEPRRRKNRGSKGRRPGRPPEVVLRSNGQKDSTEQPSLMKPYYLSD